MKQHGLTVYPIFCVTYFLPPEYTKKPDDFFVEIVGLFTRCLILILLVALFHNDCVDAPGIHQNTNASLLVRILHSRSAGDYIPGLHN